MTRIVVLGMVIVGLLARVAAADIDFWRFKQIVGFVRNIAVDPTNANNVYIAASNAATYYGEHGNPIGFGVYRSTNGGSSFSAVNNGLTSLHVSSLAIDPSAPDTVYAGTVEDGVFKTTNGGASWTPMNTGLGANLDVYSVAVDPVTPSNVYIGLDLGGIYRSVNGGASWTAAGGTGGLTVWQIVIDPTNPAILYAGTTSGVRKSVNSGATWSSTGQLIVIEDGNPRSIFDVRAVLIDASNSSTVFAGAHEGGGVFKSTNGGANWVHSSTGLFTQFSNWRFMNVLAQDPTNPATLYASSTRSTYRSIDGGSTWVVFNTGLSRGEAYGLTTTSVGGAYISDVFGDFHKLSTKPSVVDHMRCFKAKQTGFAEQTVSVSDRFGSESVTAFKVYRFCTPTSASGDPITDATTHILCYKLRGGKFSEMFIPFLSQRLDGYRAYDVNRRDSLCVPAEIDGSPSAVAHDSYRCMSGRHWTSDRLDMTLIDTFGMQPLNVTKNDRVCGPTDINGDGRLEPTVDLRCDRIYGGQIPVPNAITVNDRFGTHAIRIGKTDSHCVPALENRN